MGETHIRQILVLQTAFIGDAILATAVLEKLHLHYPDASIDFLVRKGNESLFNGHPFLRKVLVRDKKQGKLRSLWQTLLEVRRAKYDLVVNLHRFASSGIIAGFSGGQHICGFDKNPYAWRYHHKVPHVIGKEAGSPHEVERNQAVIAHLTDAVPAAPRLYPSEADFAAVRQNTAYICVAPTSVWFTKQWPVGRWISFIKEVDPKFTVFLLGAPEDQAACEAIAQGCYHHNVQNMTGKLTLLQSAGLMQSAKMNYVNDSAPMHLATAMNAPVTAIYCSTVPEFGFGPRSTQSHVVQTELKLECKPCGLHGYKACPLGHFKCSEIKTSQLLQTLVS
jgi:ADP-heptose:LPS heptosyltransferase